MVSTTRIRLMAGPHTQELDAMGARWGRLERALHAGLVRMGPVVPSKMDAFKTAFCAEHAITSRQYNALFFGLKGMYASRTACYDLEIEGLLAKAAARRSKREALIKKLAKHAAVAEQVAAREAVGKGPTPAQRKARLAPEEAAKAKAAVFRHGRVIHRIEAKVAGLQKKKAQAIPSIVFGGAKRLRQRHQLADAAAIAAWRTEWDAARASEIFAMGSSDETLGNQSCALVMDWDKGVGTIRLRALSKEQGYIVVPHVALNPHARRVLAAWRAGVEAVEAWDAQAPERRAARAAAQAALSPEEKQALARAKAEAKAAALALKAAGVKPERVVDADRPQRPSVPKISFRFVRSKAPHPRFSPWEVLITVDEAVPEAPAFRGHGGLVLGVDINGDHLACALTTPDGNPVGAPGLPAGFCAVPMPLDGKTAAQRAAAMGDAAKAVVDLAVQSGARLAMEALDFTKRKREMMASPGSAKRNRALSAFPYSALHALLTRRAQRAGVAVARVNPAYTSVVGRVKTAPTRGVSVHQGAALAIARRALGFDERYKVSYGSDGTALAAAEQAGGTSWTIWGQIRRRLREHDAQAWLRRREERANRPAASPASRPIRDGANAWRGDDGVPDFDIPPSSSTPCAHRLFGAPSASG